MGTGCGAQKAEPPCQSQRVLPRGGRINGGRRWKHPTFRSEMKAHQKAHFTTDIQNFLQSSSRGKGAHAFFVPLPEESGNIPVSRYIAEKSISGVDA